jgi:hypothetical protein
MMASSILNSDDGVISGTAGLKSVGGDDGNLVFQSKGTETARINTDKQIVAAAGTVSLPALTTTGDVNTGIFFPGADRVGIVTSGSQRVEVDANGTIIYTQTTLASYLWTTWNPSNLTGSVTNAPATGTADDSNYVTMANSSGTLTITFDVAGKYFIGITQQTAHGNIYSFDRQTATLGGTATRQISYNPTNSGVDSNNANFSITTGFYVSATAAQTLTILPTYELTGGGTTAQHIASCNVTIQYCGG